MTWLDTTNDRYKQHSMAHTEQKRRFQTFTANLTDGLYPSTPEHNPLQISLKDETATSLTIQAVSQGIPADFGVEAIHDNRETYLIFRRGAGLNRTARFDSDDDVATALDKLSDFVAVALATDPTNT